MLAWTGSLATYALDVVMTEIFLFSGSVIFFSSLILAAIALLWKGGYWPFSDKGTVLR